MGTNTVNGKNFFRGFQWRENMFFSVSGLFLITGLFYCTLSEKTELVILLAQKRTPLLNELFLFLTRFGEEHIFIALIVIIVFFSFRKALTLTIAGAGTIVFSYLAKLIFSQPRPYTVLENMGKLDKMGEITGYHFYHAYNSFPSGHTFSAFTLFTLLALFTRSGWMKLIYAITAVAAGFSRIYLGQHFVCDVVFGAFLGILTGLISYFLVFIRWSKTLKDVGLTYLIKKKFKVSE